MAEPFLSEIRMFSFGFPPSGWAFCNGQTLPIKQNQALFRLLGIKYGGDGETTFALPDLRGSTPIHFGGGFPLAHKGGEVSHTLVPQEIPPHSHRLAASSLDGNEVAPAGAVLAAVNNVYGPAGNPTRLPPASVAETGGLQPHENMQPYVAVNFCIALRGTFPSPPPTPK